VPLGRHAIVGVHTRLTDEVEPWKIQRSFQMANEMGARWAVEYFPWGYIEYGDGRFDWRHSDLVVNAAYAAGLTLVARLDWVPEWARPPQTNPKYLTPEARARFATFAAAFAERYRGRIRHYIVWNEPNLTAEWGFRPVDPAGYAELLRLTSTAIKRADPGAIVLAAGLAPTLERSAAALDDLDFLEGMYAAGVAPYFDMVAVHAYGWKAPPDEPAAPDRVNFARVELVRHVLEQHGDAAKPILITEGGWNDSPRWTKSVRPAQRAAYTVRAYQKAEAEWAWVAGVCFWTFRLPRPARNYNDYFTFVDQEFRPRPVYRAVQAYALSP
jgi:GH35 family endo-1,4-beta-xylanase